MKKKKHKSRQPNAWYSLVKTTYAEMKAKDPKTKLKDAMIAAKKVYKK